MGKGLPTEDSTSSSNSVGGVAGRRMAGAGAGGADSGVSASRMTTGGWTLDDAGQAAPRQGASWAAPGVCPDALKVAASTTARSGRISFVVFIAFNRMDRIAALLRREQDRLSFPVREDRFVRRVRLESHPERTGCRRRWRAQGPVAARSRERTSDRAPDGC